MAFLVLGKKKGVHMTEIQRPEELEVELDKHQDAKLRLRLLFLRFLHQNFDDMKYACESFKIGLATAYEWVHKWNQGGIKLLEDHKNSGRPPKLKKEEVEQLKTDLDGKNWEV